ncbi:carboxypeptidase-like regulatory domain-containing protein [Neolewinella persica]|uniref:carboxypeptidase-like regulatory domain-containing protein n=1 Tax=Neolewinella persica TaxID=70998 RepID=UPI000366CB06|nr:carboxypeptidase-like regulatory domain-containing protein [Neolewinella persica]
MTPKEIRKAIELDRMDEAIEGLRIWGDNSGDRLLQSQTIQLAGRWNSLKGQEISGILSNAEAGIARARIRAAILSLTKDDGTDPGYMPKPIVPQPSPQLAPVLPPVVPLAPSEVTPPTPPKPDPVLGPRPSHSGDKNNQVAGIVGVVFIALAALLAVLINCPTSFQYWIFMTILALGAGMVAYLISGAIKVIKIKGAEGVGGFAVFILVLFLQPLQLISTDDGCNATEPFTMTLALQADKPNPAYPDYEASVNNIQLWTGNEYRTGDVNSNLVVDFKNMPPPILNKHTQLRLLKPETSPWKLAMDSVLVKPSGQQIRLVPSGMLGKLEGRVRDKESKPLAGAIIRYNSLSDTADVSGRFQLEIPLKLQRESYPVEVTATGFKVQRLDAYSHSEVEVVMEK